MEDHDDEMVHLVAEALRELASNAEIEIPAVVSGETPLFGEEGLLESLALVTLIVSVEEQIEERFGRAVTLADEKALSQRNSPYRTVGSLAAYATSLLEGDGDGG